MTINKKMWNFNKNAIEFRKFIHQNSQTTEKAVTHTLYDIQTEKIWRQKPGIDLPTIQPEDDFERIIFSRRTKRVSTNVSFNVASLARLLNMCLGISDREHKFFCYPSPGATYATTVFLHVSSLDKQMFFRFNPYENKLEYYMRTTLGDINEIIKNIDFQQYDLKIFLASDYQLIEEKYNFKTYRLINQEVGHMAQNLLLYATKENIDAVPYGGYYEEAFHKIVGTDYDLLYVIVMG